MAKGEKNSTKLGQNGRQRPESESERVARGALKDINNNEMSTTQKRRSGGILSGEGLVSDSARRHYPFALYICALIIIYMGFIFAGQRIQREEIACRLELQRLRSKSLLLSTQRLEAVSHDKLIEEIERRGLDIKQHNKPPMVIGNNE